MDDGRQRCNKPPPFQQMNRFMRPPPRNPQTLPPPRPMGPPVSYFGVEPRSMGPQNTFFVPVMTNRFNGPPPSHLPMRYNIAPPHFHPQMPQNNNYIGYNNMVYQSAPFYSPAAECVLLYIDNSNIFENAKKHSAKKKGYRVDDVACRIDHGKLIKRVTHGRKILVANLYGSEPPANDSLWEALRRKQLNVKIFKRSEWTGKEKLVDTTITADATADIILKTKEAGDSRTVILFSGDIDLSPVVDKAQEHGYATEVWSFKSSFNKKYKREGVLIKYIDDIFDDVSSTEVVWNKETIPHERSIIARVMLPADCDKEQILKEVVDKAGSLFQLPMYGRYENNYIILIPCIEEIYTPPTRPNRTNSEDEHKPQKKYSFSKHIQPFLFQLEEHFSFLERVIPYQQFKHEERKGSDSPSFVSNNLFDQLPPVGDGAESGELDETVQSEIFVSNDLEEEHLEDVSSNVDDGFKTKIRKNAKTKRLYSDLCPFKFWCNLGSQCHFTHTWEHKEFFKVQPIAFKRRMYKTELCSRHYCPYNAKLYLCAFAHNVEESRCLCCKEHGSHWMKECPLNRKH